MLDDPRLKNRERTHAAMHSSGLAVRQLGNAPLSSCVSCDEAMRGLRAGPKQSSEILQRFERLVVR
jgi:hypothetical protein